jgi:septum formation protein
LLILASTSPTRKNLLKQAGVAFEPIAPQLDEKELQSQLRDKPVETLALSLAEAKSISLAASFPNSIIIGADQTLTIDGTIFHKPTSRLEAEKQLQSLRGKAHTLTSAMCCTVDGTIVWRFTDQASLTMRNYSDEFLINYLDNAKDGILTSVGCYKLEAEGIQLFESIKGDYFTILGFPLLPLLTFLRSREILPS